MSNDIAMRNIRRLEQNLERQKKVMQETEEELKYWTEQLTVKK